MGSLWYTLRADGTYYERTDGGSDRTEPGVDRTICSTQVESHEGNHYWVSTVFLGLDHSYGEDNVRPLVFETMVFATDESGKDIDYAELLCYRYTTIQQARDGHDEAVFQAITDSLHYNPPED